MVCGAIGKGELKRNGDHQADSCSRFTRVRFLNVQVEFRSGVPHICFARARAAGFEIFPTRNPLPFCLVQFSY
jgi:hypothetical protein